MYLGTRVAVVVPAYNEAPHIRDVLESLPPLVDRAYVVDDASTDGTWGEIRAALAQAPSSRTVVQEAEGVTDGGPTGGTSSDRRSDGAPGERAATRPPGEFPVQVPEEDAGPAIVAVRHPENRGRGAAVKKGYRLALADEMDVVAVLDGDGQMDPSKLEHIVHPVAADIADYAKGNRLDGPEYWREMSGWRLLGNVLLTGLTRVSSGYWGLRDPQNGYTAVSRATLEELDLDGVYDDYGFLNDVLAELNMVGARVADVSLPAVYGEEDSGIRYRQFVPAVSALLLVNFLRRLYVDGTRRGHVWLPATYVLAAVGWVGSLLATVGTAVASLGGTPSPLALAVAGMLATGLAVGLDRLQNAGLERHRWGVETG